MAGPVGEKGGGVLSSFLVEGPFTKAYLITEAVFANFRHFFFVRRIFP